MGLLHLLVWFFCLNLFETLYNPDEWHYFATIQKSLLYSRTCIWIEKSGSNYIDACLQHDENSTPITISDSLEYQAIKQLIGLDTNPTPTDPCYKYVQGGDVRRNATSDPGGSFTGFYALGGTIASSLHESRTIYNYNITWWNGDVWHKSETDSIFATGQPNDQWETVLGLQFNINLRLKDLYPNLFGYVCQMDGSKAPTKSTLIPTKATQIPTKIPTEVTVIPSKAPTKNKENKSGKQTNALFAG